MMIGLLGISHPAQTHSWAPRLLQQLKDKEYFGFCPAFLPSEPLYTVDEERVSHFSLLYFDDRH